MFGEKTAGADEIAEFGFAAETADGAGGVAFQDRVALAGVEPFDEAAAVGVEPEREVSLGRKL